MTDIQRRTAAYAVLVVVAGLIRWAGLSWEYAGTVLIAVVVCQAIAGWTAGRSVVPAASLPQPMEQSS